MSSQGVVFVGCRNRLFGFVLVNQGGVFLIMFRSIRSRSLSNECKFKVGDGRMLEAVSMGRGRRWF